MIRVSFKTSIEFDEETWERFQKKWNMPSALLHSILKSILYEGFQAKYEVHPKTVGIFPLDGQARVKPERIEP